MLHFVVLRGKTAKTRAKPHPARDWRVVIKQLNQKIAKTYGSPLVRNVATQNSPDFNRPGCLPRRAHIQGLALYRSAPFVPKGFRVSPFQCFLSVLNQHIQLSPRNILVVFQLFQFLIGHRDLFLSKTYRKRPPTVSKRSFSQSPSGRAGISGKD